MRRLRAGLLAAVIFAAPPISARAQETDSLLSFGMKFWDATLTNQQRSFHVYIHPKHDRLLLQPTMSEALTGAPAHWPLEFWRAAAEQFVAPVGCGISDVVADSKAGGSWEATYVCPESVDLRALIAAQRADLKAGLPLHP